MSLWRHRDFMKLWTGQTISQLGTQVSLLAIPLTAVVTLKAGTFEVGALTAVEFAPFLLVGLPAGVWVDRLRRRPILIAADVGRALTLGSIPVAYALGTLSIWHLYAVSLVSGCLTVFFDVSYQSYLPSLVERAHLVEGNAKLEISRSGAQLAGPGLAGLLIGAMHPPPAITVDAASYVASVLFLLAIAQREPAPHRDGAATGMWSEIKQGLGFVLHHEYLRPIAMCTGTSNLFGTMAVAILVLFEVRGLGLSPAAIGGIAAAGNVGFLLGAVLARRIGTRLGVGPTILAGAAVFAAAGFLLPLAPRSSPAPVLVVSLAMLSGGSAVYNITQVSLRQTITAEGMLGRMNATMRFLVWGTMPIGSLLGGALGGAIGLRPTLWVAAAGGTLAVVPVLVSRVRSIGEMPAPALEAGPAVGPAAAVARPAVAGGAGAAAGGAPAVEPASVAGPVDT
jgi:MFS family permease